MKAFWDLFTGEITHEYTCTSCKSTSQNQEPFNYLLLKFPDEHHEGDQSCTVEFLIEYHLQEENIEDYQCGFCEKNLQQQKSQPLLSIPSSCAFYSVAVEETIMAVQFPALGFDIKGDNMPYDFSATVHHMPRRDGSGHYTAIVRSRDLQSQEWFMYDDDRVSPSKFTNMQKKHTITI
jgi:ubiquitin C-terminal hydrolase